MKVFYCNSSDLYSPHPKQEEKKEKFEKKRKKTFPNGELSPNTKSDRDWGTRVV